MKNKKSILIVLALLLAACLSVTALAEGTSEAPADSTASDAAKSALDEAQAAADAAKAEDTALKEALEAYSKAKAESRKLKILSDLKEELDAYVAAGSLTQEQADLILKYYAEQLTAQKNGHWGRGGRHGRGWKNYGRGWNKGYGKKNGRYNRKTPAEPQSQAQVPEAPKDQGANDI